MTQLFNKPCGNCQQIFPVAEMKQFHGNIYCKNCIAEVKADFQKSKEGTSKKKRKLSDNAGAEEESVNVKVAQLEGKIEELEKFIIGNSVEGGGTGTELTEILKNIAENLSNLPATTTQESMSTQITDKIVDNEGKAARISKSLPPLPVLEFRVPPESEVKRCIHTPSVFDWGTVVDLVVKFGWHRSYHAFLAFLRMLDKDFASLLENEYVGKPKQNPPKSRPKAPSMDSAWVSSVARHVELLQSKGLMWRDFTEPSGGTGQRNAYARWQQTIVDCLIGRGNAPTSSRELAEVILPAFPSPSADNVKRRMLQNVVAHLARKQVIVPVNLAEYPKKYAFPDARIATNQE